MNTTRRLHHAAELSYVQSKAGVLERFLHLSLSEEAQISTPLGAGAVRLRLGQLLERRPQFLGIILALLEIQSACAKGAAPI